eukprot:427539-Rhodomonas_salina.1
MSALSVPQTVSWAPDCTLKLWLHPRRAPAAKLKMWRCFALHTRHDERSAIIVHTRTHPKL